MAKPTITTRNTKGSPLNYAELDANFTNLRDATITVTDGTNSTAIDLNGTIEFAAGANMTVTENNGVITVAATSGTELDVDTIKVGNNTVSGNVLIKADGDLTRLKGLRFEQDAASGANPSYIEIDRFGAITIDAKNDALILQGGGAVELSLDKFNEDMIITLDSGHLVIVPSAVGNTPTSTTTPVAWLEMKYGDSYANRQTYYIPLYQ